MPLTLNLRHLTRKAASLNGELPVEELELEVHDEMIRAGKPLYYELEAELLDRNILVQGKVILVLDCKCVRCLKPFQRKVELRDYTCLLPLDGEDRVAVVDDSVDLTPYLREDILLAFPAHPVCEQDCAGLAGSDSGSKKKSSSQAEGPSAWAELDKLKFRS